MQATLPMPVQTATLAACNGNVKLIRNGHNIACEPGMQLLPGDRIVAGNSGHAEIQFSGVTEHVVVEHGSAATMALQTVQLDQPAQWVVTDLDGSHVFMEDSALPDQQANAHQTHTPEHASLQGLVSDSASAATTPAETGNHHWGESLLGLGAVAFLAADGGGGTSVIADPTLSAAGNDASGSSAQPAPQPAPQPADPQQPTGSADPDTNNGNGGNTSSGNLLTDLLHLQQSPGVSSTASHNPGLNDLLQGVLGQHKSA